ncbi:MAG: sulfotransferase family 2 domain-containing protein [Chlamydiia bacterium]
MHKYIKVISVRNPMYRCISMYNEIMKVRKDGNYKVTLASNFYRMRKNIRASFCSFLNEIKDNFYDVHITHQYRYVTEKGLTLADMDHIIIFEELESGLISFFKKYNFPLRLEKINQSTNLWEVREIIRLIHSSPKIQKQIRELWSEDFEFYEEAKRLSARSQQTESRIIL